MKGGGEREKGRDLAIGDFIKIYKLILKKIFLKFYLFNFYFLEIFIFNNVFIPISYELYNVMKSIRTIFDIFYFNIIKIFV